MMFPYRSLAPRQGCGRLKRGRAQKAEVKEFFHLTPVPKTPAGLQGEDLVLFFLLIPAGTQSPFGCLLCIEKSPSKKNLKSMEASQVSLT